MCLNCPIPWEMASLGDDWSPTWVEGIVDKLPPFRGIEIAGAAVIKMLFKKGLKNLTVSVVGYTLIITTTPRRD